MISKWLEDLASDFWGSVGNTGDFPRALEENIVLHRPVNIVTLAGLSPRCVREWLESKTIPVALDTQERWLNGCFVANQGHGLLFIEETLQANDRRMIVAHEFAHYLAEYEYPRQRAARQLGNSVIEVFDGKRPASTSEHLAAALAGVALGCHVHYMDRQDDGTYAEATNAVERTANELALELMAPWRTIMNEMVTPDVDGVCEQLQACYGLPISWALPYARRLLTKWMSLRTFSETLGF